MTATWPYAMNPPMFVDFNPCPTLQKTPKQNKKL